MVMTTKGPRKSNPPAQNQQHQQWLVSMPPISDRELQCLRLLATGKQNVQIAAELELSVNTLKHHLTNIYQKLGVTTRVEAINVARQRGLLPLF